MTEIGVVLAGGTGSRLAPLTKTVNKHLLPVRGFPMLHWPLRTLAGLGIRQAVVVLGGRSCGEVVEHFGTRYDTGSGVVSLCYVYQERPGGIPQALAQALDVVEAVRADRVVVVLGDNVFPSPPESFRKALDAHRGWAVALAKVVEDARSYGCVMVERGTGRPDTSVLVEKPTAPPTEDRVYVWAALLGLYAFPVSGLRGTIEGLRPSGRGELEVVDVLTAFRDAFRLGVAVTTGAWIDAGDPPGYALANDPAFWQPA